MIKSVKQLINNATGNVRAAVVDLRDLTGLDLDGFDLENAGNVGAEQVSVSEAPTDDSHVARKQDLPDPDEFDSDPSEEIEEHRTEEVHEQPQPPDEHDHSGDEIRPALFEAPSYPTEDDVPDDLPPNAVVYVEEDGGSLYIGGE